MFALTADAHESADFQPAPAGTAAPTDFLEILSDSEITNGTYAYKRLSDTTAGLSYLLFHEDGDIESGEIRLSFESVEDGVLTGTYVLVTDSGTESGSETRVPGTETGVFVFE